MTKEGKSQQAGMRVNDVILQINDTPADDLTLMEVGGFDCGRSGWWMSKEG